MVNPYDYLEGYPEWFRVTLASILCVFQLVALGFGAKALYLFIVLFVKFMAIWS